ncbi:hypothetical protein [Spirosoma aerolatum]|uniref:hypothetical protein n=1 Tax=Spirosoma aerolatum TaxID=1211326 RepID=UPI0009AC3694|nr:hypothetical protein [Spirosoma aerolatum]
MNRLLPFLLGPEFVWVGLLAITGLFISFSQPLPPNDHDKLLNAGWFLPGLGVLLAFATLYWVPGGQWWWLLRVGLASLVGIFLVVNFLCEAAIYNDSRDSGIGSAYILFIGLGISVLAIMGCIAAVCFIAKWPFLNIFKWMLIALGTLIVFGGFIGWLASFGNHKA